MNKLIISGCSWSCGVWNQDAKDNKVFLEEDCFTNMLKHNFMVFNISKGGRSNWESLFSILNFQYLPELKYHIILFQTDFSRMALSEKFGLLKQDIKEKLEEANDLKIFFQSISEFFYYKVDSVTEIIDKPINVVGGLGDIDIDFCKRFNNINVFCESWKSLLDSEYTPHPIPTQIDSNIFKMAMDLKRFDLCDEIEHHNFKNFHNYERLLSNEHIGSFLHDDHPNQSGFKIMSDYILDNQTELL